MQAPRNHTAQCRARQHNNNSKKRQQQEREGEQELGIEATYIGVCYASVAWD